MFELLLLSSIHFISKNFSKYQTTIISNDDFGPAQTTKTPALSRSHSITDDVIILPDSLKDDPFSRLYETYCNLIIQRTAFFTAKFTATPEAKNLVEFLYEYDTYFTIINSVLDISDVKTKKRVVEAIAMVKKFGKTTSKRLEVYSQKKKSAVHILQTTPGLKKSSSVIDQPLKSKSFFSFGKQTSEKPNSPHLRLPSLANAFEDISLEDNSIKLNFFYYHYLEQQERLNLCNIPTDKSTIFQSHDDEQQVQDHEPWSSLGVFKQRMMDDHCLPSEWSNLQTTILNSENTKLTHVISTFKDYLSLLNTIREHGSNINGLDKSEIYYRTEKSINKIATKSISLDTIASQFYLIVIKMIVQLFETNVLYGIKLYDYLTTHFIELLSIDSQATKMSEDEIDDIFYTSAILLNLTKSIFFTGCRDDCQLYYEEFKELEKKYLNTIIDSTIHLRRSRLQSRNSFLCIVSTLIEYRVFFIKFFLYIFISTIWLVSNQVRGEEKTMPIEIVIFRTATTYFLLQRFH